MKRPWFSFYASDWLTDSRVRRMTPEERGFYIDLLTYSWTEDGIPNVMIQERHALARICGVSSRRFERLWTSIRDTFVEDSQGFHFNPRLERERERADKFSENQSNKAKSKWAKYAAAESPAYASDSTSQHSTSQEKKDKSASAAPRDDFDFEAVYAVYPRKKGKTIGLARCKAQIKTAERYTELNQAVANYSKSVEGKDPEFIKQFDGFMNKYWLDWINPDPSVFRLHTYGNAKTTTNGERQYTNAQAPVPHREGGTRIVKV